MSRDSNVMKCVGMQGEVVSQKVSDCITSYEYGGSGCVGVLQGFGLRAFGALYHRKLVIAV